jgi:phosphonate transport system ATP-binding protein
MIQLKNVKKIYPGNILALDDINVYVEPGEFLVFLGPSGAGKSTLMRCINRLVEPTSGEIYFDGNLVDPKKTNLRLMRQQIGMIFQQFNLIGRLSVVKNVLVGRLSHMSTALSLLHIFTEEDKKLALECLGRVELEEKAYQRADTLSGGEQQRVGIARAIVQKPKLILADEPVASLDPKIARGILGYLKKINREDNITVICSLHQVEYALEVAEKVIGLSEGRVVFEGKPSELTRDKINMIYRIKS